jgi:beta-glucanase (GH16 family)
MPQDSVYGVWPRSGEIDIMESRGNPTSYTDGIDFVSSTLHWGPTSGYDAYWRTTGSNTLKQTTFADGYHTFGLEWSENYIYTWLDSPLRQTFYLAFPTEGFWQMGNFGDVIVNNTLMTDPWNTTDRSAPFDQAFYLILDIAVGGTNSYFLDDVGGKPWVDATGPLAAGEFWLAADQWLPTWGKGNDGGMSVKSVKMWQQGACA